MGSSGGGGGGGAGGVRMWMVVRRGTGSKHVFKTRCFGSSFSVNCTAAATTSSAVVATPVAGFFSLNFGQWKLLFWCDWSAVPRGSVPYFANTVPSRRSFD